MIKQTELKWWAYKKEWGKRSGTAETEISKVQIFNAQGEQANRFKPGEKLRLKTEFIVHEEVAKPHFGVAIFREDGIYCYGPNTLLDRCSINRLKKGNGYFSIEFTNLILAPGAYRISVAIWDKQEMLPYSYHPGCYKIEIIGENQDEKLLSLGHCWQASAQETGLKPQNCNLTILQDKWKKKITAKQIQIAKLEFLDKTDKLKNNLELNQELKIKVQLKKKHALLNHYLWIGLFRKDGVYCHGAWKRLNADEQECCLIYPKLSLLPGNFLASVGIWQVAKTVPVVCDHGLYPFKLSFASADHGTVYLEHNWELKLPR